MTDAGGLAERLRALSPEQRRGLAEMRLRRPATLTPPPATGVLVEVLASFTAAPLEPGLDFWWSLLGIPVRTAFAPYGQLVQPLLDQPPLAPPERGAVTVIVLRWEDWLRFTAARSDPDRACVHLERCLADLATALGQAARSRRGAVLIFLCPASERCSTDEWTGVFTYAYDQLAGCCAATPGLSLVPVAPFAAAYGVPVRTDEAADRLAHIPYDEEFFSVLATVVARGVVASATRRRVQVLLDPQWTLPGRPAANGTTCEQPRRDLHRLLPAVARRREVLLPAGRRVDCCADMRLLQARGPIRWLDTPAAETNDGSVAAIGRSLDTGTVVARDSILLTADPATDDGLTARHPELATLSLPADPVAVRQRLEHAWVFDHGRLVDQPDDISSNVRVDVAPARLREVAESLCDGEIVHQRIAEWRRARVAGG